MASFNSKCPYPTCFLITSRFWSANTLDLAVNNIILLFEWEVVKNEISPLSINQPNSSTPQIDIHTRKAPVSRAWYGINDSDTYATRLAIRTLQRTAKASDRRCDLSYTYTYKERNWKRGVGKCEDQIKLKIDLRSTWPTS